DRRGDVVEDRADVVAPAAGPARANAEDRGRDQAQREERACGDPSHGPGGGSVGSQSRLPLVSRNGAEPSGGGWTAAPGQRAVLRGTSPFLPLSEGGSASSTAPVGVSSKLKLLKIGWTRAKWPLAS